MTFEARVGRRIANTMGATFAAWMVLVTLTHPSEFALVGLVLVAPYTLIAWVIFFVVGWGIGVLLAVDLFGTHHRGSETPSSWKTIGAVIVLATFSLLIGEYGYREHLYAVAKNQATGPADLRSIWHSYWGRRDELVRNALAGNPACPSDVLLKIADVSDLNLAPPWGLRAVTKGRLKSDLEEVIQNRNTPEAVLERLSRNTVAIRRLVAQRRSLPETIGGHLACDSDAGVRAQVELNTGTTCQRQ